jgi:hypothetical protein
MVEKVMPALDYCHPQIVRALEKDGWAMSDRPIKPQAVYNTIFASTVQHALTDNRIKLVVVDLDEERIIQWFE